MENMNPKTAILAVILAVCVCMLSIKLVNFLFRRVEKKTSSVALRFFNSISNVGIVVATMIVIFNLFPSVNTLGSQLFQSGSIALALFTFAAQKPLGNLISGLILSISNPFSVGQKIRVVNGGTVVAEGIVTGMTMRHTVVEQYDGQTCIVPNSVMDEAVIVNTNYTDYVGNFLEFEIGYSSDVKLAKEIVEDVCNNTEGVVSHGNVLVNRFTENGVILKIQVTSKDLNASFLSNSNIRETVLRRFRENSIDIPYNTITITKD
ncbi:MAG: mechanosensitive ion channel family protein [Lachnospiraceae bacterium]|nr:mechanosensitive ion channel family protein [Lachnospiraceae bacterium]